MLSRQDIVKRLNHLTLRYNLTWDDVKYDADRAIAKINNHLGTIFPVMSRVLLTPDSTYTFRSSTVDPVTGEVNEAGERSYLSSHADLGDEYILNIVIPFIATEVLARDEEFTTVYNKYLIDIENGLFDMFQKEFNRVPYTFRQPTEQGVFFGKDTAQNKIVHDNVEQLPTTKFRVIYHLNLDDAGITAGCSLPVDNNAYSLGETAEVMMAATEPLITAEGLHAYEFVGWTRSPQVGVAEYPVGAAHTLDMLTDRHMYAVWNKIDTIGVYNGNVYVKNEYKAYIHTLVIPTSYNGAVIEQIPSYFTKCSYATGSHVVETEYEMTNLSHVILPTRLEIIKAHAFDDVESLEEVEFQYVSGASPDITIETYAFTNVPSLDNLRIPTNVNTVAIDAIRSIGRTYGDLDVYLPFDHGSRPVGWDADWVNWDVEVKNGDSEGVIDIHYTDDVDSHDSDFIPQE